MDSLGALEFLKHLGPDSCDMIRTTGFTNKMLTLGYNDWNFYSVTGLAALLPTFRNLREILLPMPNLMITMQIIWNGVVTYGSGDGGNWIMEPRT